MVAADYRDVQPLPAQFDPTAYIFHPYRVWERCLASDSYAEPLVIVTLASVFLAIGMGVFSRNFILFLPFVILNWFVSASVYHLFANLAGGRGSIRSGLRVWAFTGMPFLFLPAFRIMSVSLNSGGIVLFVLFAAVLAWTVLLKIDALRFVYHLSPALAAAVFVMPVFFMILLSAAALVIYGLVYFI